MSAAARRKGEKELSRGWKVGLCSPDWEMELLGLGSQNLGVDLVAAEVGPASLKRNATKKIILKKAKEAIKNIYYVFLDYFL